MRISRILAPLGALALAASTTLTAPAASALPATPVSPPTGTEGTCEVSLSTTSNVPGSNGGQNTASIPRTVSMGVQNYSNANGAFGFRPWVRVYGVAERWMTDTKVEFITDGPEATYNVNAHTNVPETKFTVPITHSFAPTVTQKGGFTSDLGDFNAEGTGWGATNAALWYSDGTAAQGVTGADVNGTLNLKTTLLPWPQENVNCQPLAVKSGAAATVVADGSPQDTGAVVTAGDAADHARMDGTVYLPGTDTPVEGATVTVNPDGTVSITVPPEVRDLTDSLEIQLHATPREDGPKWEAYNVNWDVGERFTVNLGDEPDVPGSGPGSSTNDRCVATASSVITPLAILAPLYLATQVDIPGVSPMIRDLQAQLQRANADLQRGLGIHNPEIARLAEQINGALGPDAERILGVAGAAALGLLAAGVIADACLGDGEGSSGSSLSSL